MFRYPGSKNRLANTITNKLFYQSMGLEKPYTYCEPFVGSGGSTITTLNRLSNAINCVILNDKSYPIFSVWKAIYQHHQKLIEGIRRVVPSTALFYRLHEKFQLEDYYKDDFVRVAVEKIALHQMSALGLGETSGGPNGGKEQENGGVGDRWNPERLCSYINVAHHVLSRFDDVRILNKGFQYVDFDDNTLLFLDPPTKPLFTHHMSMTEHRILANMLKDRKHWVMYLGKNSVVRKLYGSFSKNGSFVHAVIK